MTIEFITTPFVASHGKQPKGKGSWAFSEERNPEIGEVFFTKSMLYSEAKKSAKQHFNGKANTIFVQG